VPGDDPQRLTFVQRRAMRQLVKKARKPAGEPLSEEDWAAYWSMSGDSGHRAMKRMLLAIPSSPRCGFCGAPFAGLGSKVLRPMGFRPSRKNPSMCDVCVELAPPGGMTMKAGVLFADVRGFTALSERTEPREVSALLRRFYGIAERVLFPEAMIDKLIGDEVMALYLPIPGHDHDPEETRARIAETMLRHARKLLEGVGYGADDGPFVELGIGLDHGEAFVGNIGEGSVRDFTAIGDVVNTASRLTGHARGGEIVVSARLADALPDPPGDAVELTVKGKAEPVPARRIAA
jgi:adenylate cyclase